jgi:hypothetical protein
MLAIGAADDCMGAAAVPLDVLEYLRWTRPYFATCRLAVDEEACLKQGKTRLTFIRKLYKLYFGLPSSPLSSSRSLAKKDVEGEQLPRFPRMLTSRLRFQCFNRDERVPQPIAPTHHHPQPCRLSSVPCATCAALA